MYPELSNQKYLEVSVFFGDLGGVKEFIAPGASYRVAPIYELFDDKKDAYGVRNLAALELIGNGD